MHETFRRTDYSRGRPPALNEPAGSGAEASNSDVYSEVRRLKTFDTWPKKSPIRPDVLAADGFVYTGIVDKVRCVFCDIVVFDWVPSDDVRAEHRKHNRHCPLLNGHATKNVPKNVRGTHVSSEFFKSHISKSIGPTNNTKNGAFGPFSGMSIEAPTKLNPKYPKLMLEDERLKTYKNWNKLFGIKPETLAKAGFYYLGSGDKVKCFNCGQNLMNWDPDDNPAKEHAKWFPDCQFIKMFQERYPLKEVEQTVTSDAHLSGIPSKIVAVMDYGYSKDQIDAALRKSKKGVNDFKSAGDLFSFVMQSDAEATLAPPGMSEEAITRMLAEEEPLATRRDTPDQKIKTGGNNKQVSEIQDIVSKNQQLKETITCKICMVMPAIIVFLPCGHLISCSECAAAVRNCPICREPIKGTVRAYMG